MADLATTKANVAKDEKSTGVKHGEKLREATDYLLGKAAAVGEKLRVFGEEYLITCEKDANAIGSAASRASKVFGRIATRAADEYTTAVRNDVEAVKVGAKATKNYVRDVKKGYVEK